ncbi:hypothetical protein ACT8ZS_20120 [Paenibacillus sp. M.A.Huq-84]
MDDGDPEVPPQFICEACEEKCTLSITRESMDTSTGLKIGSALEK